MKTTRNALAVLGKLLRFVEECEVIEMVTRIKLPKVGESPFDFLKFDEADRLLAASKDTQWHGIIHTALRTGMRFGELTELRWGDVDLVAGMIVVSRGYYLGHVDTPKNGKIREIPLSPAAIRILNEERHLRHMNADALVFCKPDGGRRIHHRADVGLKRICRKADLRPIG